MVENKRKKHHDKDKYYRLAKEQGFRSRAAFKLTQINRKFHFLDNAKTVVDLCAAPGGWTQVVSRALPRSNVTIVAVDVLPIRALPNVITLIGDITTDKCKAHIKSELQTMEADVVLCDGAPNVGGSYEKDAYQQNEIALHALKSATLHLRQNGWFVTKFYRSSDYTSYLWTLQQFFTHVQAVKPNASRSQSSEIYMVCSGYLKPDRIDPKLLDPKYMFEQVADEHPSSSSKLTIFHKSFNDRVRSRQGYDMTLLDSTMRTIAPVCDFVDDTKKDPVQLLSVCTSIQFSCQLCSFGTCNCNLYLTHKLTTTEIKTCLADLKVLNRSDFKGLLVWRTKMQEASKLTTAAQSSDDEEEEAGKEKEEEVDEEEKIQLEIEQLKQKRARERKRLLKKERELMAKKRKRSAFTTSIDVPDNDKIFSLATITNKGDLEAVREIDLSQYTDDQLFPTHDDDDDDSDEDGVALDDGAVESQGEEDDIDENTGYDYRLDRELDGAYDRYLANTKSSNRSGTKMAKRSKKALRLKAMNEAKEDDELVIMNSDTRTYAKMLQGPQDSDNDDDDIHEEEDDGFYSDPLTLEEHEAKNAAPKKPTRNEEEDMNPLVYTLPDDPTSVKTARWFSNPLFQSIGNAASLAALTPKKHSKASGADYDSEDDIVLQHIGSSDDEKVSSKKRRKKGAVRSGDEDDVTPTTGLRADDILAMMPKTDKQVRHEKRKKVQARLERKLAKRARISGEEKTNFEIVEGNDDEADEKQLTDLDEKQLKKVLEARELIKAGLGNGNGIVAKSSTTVGFEVVSATESKVPLSLARMDHRKYDSENEDYDSDDYAQTLALGTMMLRRSKAKSLVDASYNRFAWNDPQDLPDWFVDDENKHYRPQLPIPQALLEKMKEKFLRLSTRPIAKVAEARARKSKRAQVKLVAAKKKAESVANSSDMSEAMKLKAISKAMRGGDASKPGKTYVISKKGGGTKGGKGIKLVDKRLKNDKRSMERMAKKKKGGKKGGLTGSKRRRNHS